MLYRIINNFFSCKILYSMILLMLRKDVAKDYTVYVKGIVPQGKFRSCLSRKELT